MIQHASAGWRNITIGVQVTPFEWHLAVSWFTKPCHKAAIGIGPICIAVYWANVKFSRRFIRDSA